MDLEDFVSTQGDWLVPATTQELSSYTLHDAYMCIFTRENDSQQPLYFDTTKFPRQDPSQLDGQFGYSADDLSAVLLLYGRTYMINGPCVIQVDMVEKACSQPGYISLQFDFVELRLWGLSPEQLLGSYSRLRSVFEYQHGATLNHAPNPSTLEQHTHRVCVEQVDLVYENWIRSIESLCSLGVQSVFHGPTQKDMHSLEKRLALLKDDAAEQALLKLSLCLN